jgi:CubicO group peptidase (beta-lactamase class C family)
MKRFSKKNSALIICIILTVHISYSQSIPSQLDILFHQVSTDPQIRFNGVVLVAGKDSIIYQNAIGFSNISIQRKNSIQTRFQLASLSKLFTAIAIMQLAEKGSIRLDDPFIKYFPSFPYADITIRQILSHTSGLPDFIEIYREKSSHALNNSDMIPALIKFGVPVSAPGNNFHYSSIGYALLANLVEKISGQSFPEYIQEHICKPAGMLHSYVLSPYMIQRDSLRAVNYRSHGADPLTSDDSIRTVLESPWQTIVGPGLMVSSAEDLLLFSESLFANKILSAETQEEMYTVVKLKDGTNTKLDRAPIYQALGWGVDIDQSSGKIVSHNGGSMGISTILLRNLKTYQTVIVLENTDNMGILAFGVNAMNILGDKPIRQFGPPPGRN